MKPTMEEQYQKIGQGIVNAIPGEWTRAWIDAHIREDVITVQGLYESGPVIPVRSFDVNEDLMDAFEAIHAIMKETLHVDWSKAHFELMPSGEFNLKYEYPPTGGDGS